MFGLLLGSAIDRKRGGDIFLAVGAVLAVEDEIGRGE
jgi:hypothetical protein